MAALLALFVARVVGQILAATLAPPWLPPMARWYSGLMPYRYLLPTQIVFSSSWPHRDVARRSPPLGAHASRTWIIWASYVYALGMVRRSLRARAAGTSRRLIPIVFHFVLAAFLFTTAALRVRRARAVARIVIARAMPSGPSTLSYHSPACARRRHGLRRRSRSPESRRDRHVRVGRRRRELRLTVDELRRLDRAQHERVVGRQLTRRPVTNHHHVVRQRRRRRRSPRVLLLRRGAHDDADLPIESIEHRLPTSSEDRPRASPPRESN